MLALHSYFRSSASYRVRIALNLKGLAYDVVPVDLRRGGGDHLRPAFLSKNPYALVPLLRDEERYISQSLAIIDYLEERFPEVPLLPAEPGDRARARQIAMAIACDVSPLTNLRVLKHLAQLGLDDDTTGGWARHWTRIGLAALETDVRSSGGRFCVGDSPTIADCCLVPLLFNADRFGVDMAAYPTLSAIQRECQALDAFRFAHPDEQPDAA